MKLRCNKLIKLIPNFTTGLILGLLLVASFSLAKETKTRGGRIPLREARQTTGQAIIISVSAREDDRAEKLERFLRSKNSPLAGQASLLVKKADENDLDWRLLAAISGIESSFGTIQPENSHNAWGWGGGYIYFDSWEEAIIVISDSLGERWAKKGGRDHWQLSKSYCPPNWYKWSMAVDKLMKEISQA